MLKNIKIYNNNLYNKQKILPIIWIKNNFIQLSVLTKEYITKIKTKKNKDFNNYKDPSVESTSKCKITKRF